MPDAQKLFEALVREHADMLLVYLRSALGSTSDVDDLFQETMIVAWHDRVRSASRRLRIRTLW